MAFVESTENSETIATKTNKLLEKGKCCTKWKCYKNNIDKNITKD